MLFLSITLGWGKYSPSYRLANEGAHIFEARRSADNKLTIEKDKPNTQIEG